MHTQVLGIAVAAVLVLLLAPGAASAQSVNGTADQGALTAYHTYLNALTADARSSVDRDGLIVDGVDGTCPDALSDLDQLSAAQLKKSALTDFADEVDADLDVAYLAPTKAALTAFATSLNALTWSTANQSAITTRLVSTERTMLSLAQPNLCSDATTLDAAPLNEPRATSKFLARYRRAAANLRGALTAFQNLLAKFETNAETRLVGEINTLVGQFSTASGTSEANDAATVLSDLGVSDSTTG